MVSVNVSMDLGALERLNGILDRVERETPGRIASETKRAGIYICQSLRSRTKKAKKNIRSYPSEWAASVSSVPPKYIHSNSAGRHLLRRWTLTRKRGTPDERTNNYYVYTDRHRGARGRMVGGSRAGELRELLLHHGGIPRAGLAKISWGWVMKQIGGSSADALSWRRTSHERRDPRNFVKGIFRRLGAVASVEIRNSLDYILDALPPGALGEALNAASKRLEHNINNHIERAVA